jgi:hypothetical protein
MTNTHDGADVDDLVQVQDHNGNGSDGSSNNSSDNDNGDEEIAAKRNAHVTVVEFAPSQDDERNRNSKEIYAVKDKESKTNEKGQIRDNNDDAGNQQFVSSFFIGLSFGDPRIMSVDVGPDVYDFIGRVNSWEVNTHTHMHTHTHTRTHTHTHTHITHTHTHTRERKMAWVYL